MTNTDPACPYCGRYLAHVGPDHVSSCGRNEPIQTLAAMTRIAPVVDDAMVERAYQHALKWSYPQQVTPERETMRALLQAALSPTHNDAHETVPVVDDGAIHNLKRCIEELETAGDHDAPANNSAHVKAALVLASRSLAALTAYERKQKDGG